MQRGEENFKKGLLENADTKYYLENKPLVEAPKEQKEVKEKPIKKTKDKE